MNLEKGMEDTSRRALIAVVGKARLAFSLGCKHPSSAVGSNTEASLQVTPIPQSFKAQPLRTVRTVCPKRTSRLATIPLHHVICGPQILGGGLEVEYYRTVPGGTWSLAWGKKDLLPI